MNSIVCKVPTHCTASCYSTLSSFSVVCTRKYLLQCFRNIYNAMNNNITFFFTVERKRFSLSHFNLIFDWLNLPTCTIARSEVLVAVDEDSDFVRR